ncbi:hypothetical protein GC722_15780 [Auraticoccus sp. F435]|uniref:Uncharacterized protein n=1 Tax=Auraticoccus cholistanensis TaxID=2656650 RepID=A0A6A9UZQ6_9ACTN|nr:Pr6Pr family membrane protein [Auraticoccus cholistanensis]MVA77467.1 hypothetical protein [Auraticoccus cholistanensis]
MPTTTVRVPTRVEGPSLAAVTLWRMLLAGCGWLGVGMGLLDDGRVQWANLAYFTQVSTLAVALTATGSLLAPLVLGGALETRWGVARGAATTYATVTLVVYALLLGGDYSQPVSLLTHVVVPCLAALDWLLVGRNQLLAWWWPLAWLAVPVLYLVTYVAGGEALYPFLDPASPGFADYVLYLSVGFLAVGYGWWGVGRLRALRWPPQTVPAAEALTGRPRPRTRRS